MEESQSNNGLIRSLTLPDDLHVGITRALAGVPASQWMREAQALSERYRAPRTGEPAPLATGKVAALAYAALVLPATYAQLRGAMAATAARIVRWQPTTLLDLGSGPGTALWAATAQWPSLQHLTAWEREPALIALGRDLARSSTTLPIRAAQWERVDLRHVPATTRRYDLVVIGHVLNELSADEQRALIAFAWDRTAGVLLIVEPGTSAAFPLVRAARDQLLIAAAQTIAPCPHDQPCPLVNDWCHFPQRLIRPPFQRAARAALSQWEDSKFTYAAMARFTPDAPIWGRVIREATSNKAYAEAKTSTRAGIARLRGLKRHKNAFHHVRKLDWGAALPDLPSEPITIIEHERVAER